MLYFTDLSHYKLRSRFLWGCLSWHVIGEFRLGLRCRSPNWGLSECELHIAMDGKVSGATLVGVGSVGVGTKWMLGSQAQLYL